MSQLQTSPSRNTLDVNTSSTTVPELGQNNTPVFVIGSARSGTTLLELMLNAHPRLAIMHETNFFYFFTHHFKQVDLRDDRLMTQFLDLLFTMRVLTHKSPVFDTLDTQEFRQKLMEAERTPRGIYECLMKTWLIQQNKPRWGEKSPLHSFEVNTIYNTFPEAKFIHLVRDPRAVTASIRKTNMSPNESMFRHADVWRYYLDKIHQALIHIPKSQVLELHYENLVQEPEQELQRICHFLHETFDSAMLEAYKDPSAILGRVADDRMFAHQNIANPVNTQSVEKWRKNLSPEEIRITEVLNQRWMKHYGYTPISDAYQLPIGEQLSAMWYRLTAPVRDWVRKRRWVRKINAQFAQVLSR